MTTAETQCVVCGRPVAGTEYGCVACRDRTVCLLAGDPAHPDRPGIVDATGPARDIATGQASHSGGGGSGKPGSRLPFDLGATQRLTAVHDLLARRCINIAVRRGLDFHVPCLPSCHVPCLPSCVKPSPSNAHCGTCHLTWSGTTGFDRHRRDGRCLTPAEIGYLPAEREDGGIVYRAPMSETEKARLTALRASQTAETGQEAPSGTPDDLDGAETLSGGAG